MMSFAMCGYCTGGTRIYFLLQFHHAAVRHRQAETRLGRFKYIDESNKGLEWTLKLPTGDLFGIWQIEAATFV